MSRKIELDSKVECFEATLGAWLDKFAKVTRVTSYSKRWGNDKIAQVRKTWAKEKRKLKGFLDSNTELKTVHNANHHIIQKSKRKCW